MKNTIYYKQVQLLLKLLPVINNERDFAIKGGTAINLFFRDMPRLSVDIDLTYLPIVERDVSLKEITASLNKIKTVVLKLFPQMKISDRTLGNTKYLPGLLISEDGVIIKIEVNTTIRGSVNPPIEISISNKVSELFEVDVTIQSLSFDDVYAGKICAALDRQHPRDFYDIKLLLENEGISDNLRKTFIIYLINNNRPIVELLNPNLIEITDAFNHEFYGMTTNKVTIEELLKSRIDLIKIIHSSLTKEEIEFLLSFKNKKPKWNLLGFTGVENLPSVKWKMINLDKMSKNKHAAAYKKLERFLIALN